VEEVLNNQLKEKEENCEKLEAEIVSLRKELDKLNKNMKISQTLDVILSSQRSPYDKTGLGYMGETSYKEDANSKVTNKEVEENLKAPISTRAREWEESGNTTTPKSYVDALKKSIHNAGNNTIRDKDQQFSPK
jgi:hypothetical protein